MTQEQERLFKKKVWDYHITENTTEYDIARYFFELGLAQKENNMDYEKAYKEARERALKLRVQNPFDTVSQMMEYVFSELKESKEEWIEKIRAEIISYLKNRQILSIPEHDAVATWISWIEKQGEQKPVDKVVPKFNVGDWIIFNEHHDSIYQVEEIQGLRYYLRHYNGGLMSVHIDNQLMRHWTIQDARDGDVLANDDHILILKELGYTWASDGNPEHLYAYCGIKPDGKFEIEKENYCFCGSLHTHPATKSQRNILFARMKEAGYEWNAEKKELRKIENSNSANVVNDLPKLTDEDIDNLNKVQSWYRCERVISAAEAENLGNWIKSFYDKLSLFQKMKEKEIKKISEWTDEDEELCQDALDAFEALANDLDPSEDWGKLYDWLKSLKQRLQ